VIARILSNPIGSDNRKAERVDHDIVENLHSCGIKDRCIWCYREAEAGKTVELRRVAGNSPLFSVPAERFASMRDDQVITAVATSLTAAAVHTHP